MTQSQAAVAELSNYLSSIVLLTDHQDKRSSRTINLIRLDNSSIFPK